MEADSASHGEELQNDFTAVIDAQAKKDILHIRTITHTRNVEIDSKEWIQAEVQRVFEESQGKSSLEVCRLIASRHAMDHIHLNEILCQERCAGILKRQQESLRKLHAFLATQVQQSANSSVASICNDPRVEAPVSHPGSS